MLDNKEEIEDYVKPLLNDNIEFNCYEIKPLRRGNNNRLKVFRLEFSWDNDGSHVDFSRREKAIFVRSVIGGYIEEVNKISSK